MFHLQTRVHLQERVLARGDVVEVLYGSHSAVPNLLCEPDSAALKLLAQLPRRNRHGAFLYDFLVSTLHRAVASVQGDCVAVLVSYDLNLQMPGVGRQLLDEHRRAGHLCLNLNEARTELLHVRHHTDSLAAASLRSLNHQREPNLLGALFRLGQVPERRREQHILGNRDVRDRQTGTRPGDHVHVARLRQDIRADLVTDGIHRFRGRSEEGDVVVRERGWELWVLRGVSPPGPNRVRLAPARHLDDQIHVGVVVPVGASFDGDELVREPDVLGVGLDIVLRRHAHDVQNLMRPECLVLPEPERPDCLHRPQAIIRDEDLPDEARAAPGQHVILKLNLGGGHLGRRRPPIGRRRPALEGAGAPCLLATQVKVAVRSRQ
mmetsp:Transcript_902/g.3582  ORF Transcript_902/g.3582 Transcript_902/m.3582 type:complete len:378 (-) Transcript_902:85-1218(-)